MKYFLKIIEMSSSRGAYGESSSYRCCDVFTTTREYAEIIYNTFASDDFDRKWHNLLSPAELNKLSPADFLKEFR